MRTLDSWLSRSVSSSAPDSLRTDAADEPPPARRPRGLRAPDQYRTNELIEEIRKNRVLWSRDARGFRSQTARTAAYKRVAAAMNRRFPDVRPWHAEEVQHHWRLLVQYQYACVSEHGQNGKPHSFTCRHDQMSFMNDALRAYNDWRSFVFRM